MTEHYDSEIESGCTIEDLPDEVLEYILSLLPPYSDLDHCMDVSPRWKKIVENVVYHSHQLLLKSLANFDIRWEHVTPSEKMQSITKRYSHSACCHGNFMYVFGGCTCTMTTFNDLWKLDLSTRQWSRLLTMGTYPSPKACATLVHHKNRLLLFGGWSHPATFLFSHVWRTFNELHIYDIHENKWQSIATLSNHPPPMAGHSATIHKDNMIIFGGLHGQNRTSNDVWCFNVSSNLWKKVNIDGIKPQPRYCQTQVVLDDEHLLILGGCGGGPNEVLSDVWMLDMSDVTAGWHWKPVAVRNPQWAPSHLWCHPACRVGDYVVAFSRNPVATAPMRQYSKLSPNGQFRLKPHRMDANPSEPGRRFGDNLVSPAVDRDVNVNGRRGSLSRSQPMETQDTNSSSSSSQASTSTAPLGRTTAVLQPLPIANSKANQAKESAPAPQCSTPHCASSSDSNSGNARTNSNHDNSRPSSSHDRSNVRNSPESRTKSPRVSDFHTVNNAHCTDMAAFSDNSQSTITKNRKTNRRIIQLDAIRRIEERLRRVAAASPADDASAKVRKQEIEPSPPECTQTFLKQPGVPKMAMFVLDISCVLTPDCYASWLPIKAVADGCPEDMIFYSLVAGNSELIMFGGMQQETWASSPNNSALPVNVISESVTNALHFITAPRSII